MRRVYHRHRTAPPGCRGARQDPRLGNVNVGAIDEYKEVRSGTTSSKPRWGDVERSKTELTRMIAELCQEMEEMFKKSFQEINRNFGRIFRELFGGGRARLYLSDEGNILDSGIEIEVSPPGKVIRNLSALSGGEQALVAISIYFAILEVNPSPFCILDEIEAALDDVNVTRYAQYLRRMTERTPVHRHHPPPRHDGGRRRPLRRNHAGGRRIQAAAA